MKQNKKLIAFYKLHKYIILVFLSYFIFCLINLTYLKLDDPYGTAMVCIGLFWLGAQKIENIINSVKTVKEK